MCTIRLVGACIATGPLFIPLLLHAKCRVVGGMSPVVRFPLVAPTALAALALLCGRRRCLCRCMVTRQVPPAATRGSQSFPPLSFERLALNPWHALLWCHRARYRYPHGSPWKPATSIKVSWDYTSLQIMTRESMQQVTRRPSLGSLPVFTKDRHTLHPSTLMHLCAHLRSPRYPVLSA